MRLAIYLPCKYNAIDKFQKQMILELTKTFSGLTIIPNCYGTWQDPKSLHVIHDSITIIEIYTKLDEDSSKFKTFFKVLSQIKQHYNQDCVAWTKNNAINFY